MAALAREKIHERLVSRNFKGGVTVHEGDAGAFRATMAPATYDLTICIGSTHALGGYQKALQVLKRLTKPGGQVLLGEGFWQQPPPPAYLEATGLLTDEFQPHWQNIELGNAEGLVPLWSITATQREWDEYEWAHQRNIEAYAANHTDLDTAREMLSRSRTWRQAYWRWGRETLGFGLYLFRV
jgi:SAM-dependent methyltransferase